MFDSSVYYEDCFYDLEADPSEQHNLVKDAQYQAVRETLAQILKEEMVKAGEKCPDILPARVSATYHSP